MSPEQRAQIVSLLETKDRGKRLARVCELLTASIKGTHALNNTLLGLFQVVCIQPRIPSDDTMTIVETMATSLKGVVFMTSDLVEQLKTDLDTTLANLK